MSASARWLCWLVVVVTTTIAVGSGMAGFAEPDESRFGIMVSAALLSIGLHAGLLGGLPGWKTLGNKWLRMMIGLLMLPATLLAVIVLIETLKRANWAGAVAAFSMSGIYLTVWIRLLGGFVSSPRKE